MLPYIYKFDSTFYSNPMISVHNQMRKFQHSPSSQCMDILLLIYKFDLTFYSNPMISIHNQIRKLQHSPSSQCMNLIHSQLVYYRIKYGVYDSFVKTCAPCYLVNTKCYLHLLSSFMFDQVVSNTDSNLIVTMDSCWSLRLQLQLFLEIFNSQYFTNFLG